MIYEFRRVHRGGTLGDAASFEYNMDSAPGIGDRIRRNGKTYQRVISLGSEQIHVDTFMDESFVSHSLPLNYEPHKLAGGKFDKRGHPVFDSKRQVQRTEHQARDFSEHDNIQHPKLKPMRLR